MLERVVALALFLFALVWLASSIGTPDAAPPEVDDATDPAAPRAPSAPPGQDEPPGAPAAPERPPPEKAPPAPPPRPPADEPPPGLLGGLLGPAGR